MDGVIFMHDLSLLHCQWNYLYVYVTYLNEARWEVSSEWADNEWNESVGGIFDDDDDDMCGWE